MDEQRELPSDRNAAYYAAVGADYFDVDGDGYVREDGTAIGLIFEGMADDLDRMRAIRTRLRAAVSDEATQPDTPAEDVGAWGGRSVADMWNEYATLTTAADEALGYLRGRTEAESAESPAPADPLAALRAMPETVAVPRAEHDALIATVMDPGGCHYEDAYKVARSYAQACGRACPTCPTPTLCDTSGCVALTPSPHPTQGTGDASDRAATEEPETTEPDALNEPSDRCLATTLNYGWRVACGHPLPCPTHRFDAACDGSSTCNAQRHIHGCFADRGNCDDPVDHGVTRRPITAPAATEPDATGGRG